MRRDFQNHLLMQIEMLRADISHQELSKRLGCRTERCLARYVVGSTHLRVVEFREIAKALNIDPRALAQQWAASLGLRVSEKSAVCDMVREAFCDWKRHTRIRGVPSSPSRMTVIRVKYADRLPRQAPPLWFGSYSQSDPTKDTPANRERFARAYEMLVESVHDNRSHRDIGALRGISGERARQLMTRAAYTWGRSVGIDFLSDKGSVPFKNDAKYVKNLYAGLRFVAQQQSGVLAGQKSGRGDAD